MGLKSILSKVLGIEESSIHDDTSPENVENWDSFNALIIVSELEKEFKVSFTIDEVTTFKSVRNIKIVLRGYGLNEQEGS